MRWESYSTEKNAIVIGLGMWIKSRTTECVHVDTDKKNIAK